MLDLGPTNCVFCLDVSHKSQPPEIGWYGYHHDCAEKYGENLKDRIFKHYETNPNVQLPKEIRDEFSSKKHKQYLNYREEVKLKERIEAHRAGLQLEAQKALESIIDAHLPELRKLLTKYGNINFEVFAKTTVTVEKERRHA